MALAEVRNQQHPAAEKDRIDDYRHERFECLVRESSGVFPLRASETPQRS
ncbi:hypothetical protein ACQSSU_14750 [Micromonospora echinospora]